MIQGIWGIVTAEIRISLPAGQACACSTPSSPLRTDWNTTVGRPASHPCSIRRHVSATSPGTTLLDAKLRAAAHSNVRQSISSTPRGITVLASAARRAALLARLPLGDFGFGGLNFLFQPLDV